MKKLLTVSQVAKALQISERSCRELLKGGVIPGAKLGGCWRISEDSFNRFLCDTFERVSVAGFEDLRGFEHVTNEKIRADARDIQGIDTPKKGGEMESDSHTADSRTAGEKNAHGLWELFSGSKDQRSAQKRATKPERPSDDKSARELPDVERLRAILDEFKAREPKG
tara:strand:- start:3241 stop:3744 length:504 start_codon:yes stop_codon:yes gene_type:complete